MNILEQKQSLFSLWLYSFSVVNKAIGKLMSVVLISVLLGMVGSLIFTLTIGTAGFLAKLQLMFLSKAVGIGILLLFLFASVVGNLYGLFFTTVCWRILGAQAEGGPLPLSEAFSSSLRPTLYQFVTAVLLSVPLLFLLILVGLVHSKILLFIVMLGLFLTVGVRLCYSFISIAIAKKGPIEGIIFSWRLTQGKGFTDALIMCLMTLGTVLLIELFFTVIAYGSFLLIPLYFAESFQLAHPSAWWFLGALIVLLIGLFFYFIVLAFPLLVFVNRHATFLKEESLQEDSTVVALPGITLPGTIDPNSDSAQQSPSTDKTDPLKLLGEEVQVSQASINTSEEETTDLSQHLDQVYTPKPDDIIEYVNEDRMPTLLFDDKMARQLQENQALLEARKKAKENKENEDNGPDAVKMSKF